MFVFGGGGGEGVLQSVKGSCVLMVAELTDKLLSKFWLSYHSQRVCHLNLYIKKFRTNESQILGPSVVGLEKYYNVLILLGTWAYIFLQRGQR